MKAVYIRTSTEDQNPANQLKDVETLSGKDYTLYEEKQSAWKDKEREKFSDLTRKISVGLFDDLYVWDLDRIYRNRIKLKEFIQFCKVHNCKIWSYRQKFINQIQELNLPKDFEFIRDMMLSNLIEMLGWIAEDESNKKSERVRISIKKENGVTKSYKGNLWGKHSLSEEVNKEIIELHIKGKSMREITQLAFYWDKNRNKRSVSLGYVHKIISKFVGENKAFNDSSEVILLKEQQSGDKQ